MSLDLSIALERFAKMGHSFLALLPNILIAAVVFTAFWFLASGLQRIVERIAIRAHQENAVGVVLGRIANWVALMVGALVAATVVFPSLDAASLFSALGIGGVAIGFAFKDIFQNLLAGILILITRPFRIGDAIISGSHEGTVEDVQIRASLIRTYDNRLVVIPNSELYTGRVVVVTAHDKRRLSTTIGIGYGDDITTAKALILDVAKKIDGVLTDPAPTVIVDALNDSTVDLEVRVWVKTSAGPGLAGTKDELLQGVKESLTQAGIDLPFPTQSVLFHDQTEKTDGDRARQREGWPERPSRTEPKLREELREEQRKALEQEEAVTQKPAQEKKAQIDAETEARAKAEDAEEAPVESKKDDEKKVA